MSLSTAQGPKRSVAPWEMSYSRVRYLRLWLQSAKPKGREPRPSKHEDKTNGAVVLNATIMRRPPELGPQLWRGRRLSERRRAACRHFESH